MKNLFFQLTILSFLLLASGCHNNNAKDNTFSNQGNLVYKKHENQNPNFHKLSAYDGYQVVKKFDQAIFNLFLEKDQESIQISHFKPWEAIDEVQISNSKNKLLVWHKAEKRKAYELTVYDLSKQKPIASITPGYGGDFVWSPNNTILHGWGCGTNCAVLKIYDQNLKTLLSLDSSGIFISIDRRSVVTYPSLYASKEPIKIWDTKNGNLLKTEELEDVPYAVQELTFIGDSKLKIAYTYGENREEKVTELSF